MLQASSCDFLHGHTHVRLDQQLIGREHRRRPLQDDAPRFQDIPAIGDGQRLTDVLLDEQDGDAAFAEIANDGEDVVVGAR